MKPLSTSPTRGWSGSVSLGGDGDALGAKGSSSNIDVVGLCFPIRPLRPIRGATAGAAFSRVAAAAGAGAGSQSPSCGFSKAARA